MKPRLNLRRGRLSSPLFFGTAQKHPAELRPVSEVKQQADLIVGCFQIVEELRFVHSIDRARALQFDNDSILDNEIGPKNPDNLIAELNFDRLLPFGSQSLGRQFTRQSFSINRLKKSVPQFVIDIIEGTDDRIRNVAMFKRFVFNRNIDWHNLLVIRVHPRESAVQVLFCFSTPDVSSELPEDCPDRGKSALSAQIRG